MSPLFHPPHLMLQNSSFMVVSRFDLKKTWRELVIAISVPSTLFVISFVALVVIAHAVKVGDDAKMRCQLCTQDPDTTGPDELYMESVLHPADSLAMLEQRAHANA